MRITLLILLCFCFSLAYSQAPKVQKLFFNEQNEVTDREHAVHYTIDSTWEDKSSSWNSFYLNPEMPRAVGKRGPNTDPKYATWYYKSGGVQCKGLFYYGTPVGMILFNHQDGKPKAEVEFPTDFKAPDAISSYIIHQYWDSLGNKLVDNSNGGGFINFTSFENTNSIQRQIIPPGTGAIVAGRKNGVWKGDTDKGTYEEVYENGKLIEGIQLIDEKKYTYTVIAVQPEFEGGLPALSSFISNNLVYPRKARRAGTQGSVFIGFIVDKDGSVIDIRTLKGISPECDAEASRVVSMMPKWKPGLLRGLPVKVRFVLPIKYVLG